MFILFWACGTEKYTYSYTAYVDLEDEIETLEPSSEEIEQVDTAEQTEDSAAIDLTADPYCFEGMVSVRDTAGVPMYCIDRFEIVVVGEELGNTDQGTSWPDGSTLAYAQSVYDTAPSTHFSWYQAVALCQNAGKYLCTTEEWIDACDGLYGEGGLSFPYGNTWETGRCAARFGGEAQFYEAPQSTGSLPDCVSEWGTYDQIGNIWEWTDPMMEDDDGRPLTHKIGASYYSGGGNVHCGNDPVSNHAPEFAGIIGARCCASPLIE